MASIENLLCIFCRNSTILSTEKPQDFILNVSNENQVNKTGLYSICSLCHKYSYIQQGTVLYYEKFSKIHKTLIDIKYNPRLICIDMNCTVCEQETTFKMFANDNFDINYKYICTKCNTFYEGRM